jgi:hypothetical protein
LNITAMFGGLLMTMRVIRAIAMPGTFNMIDLSRSMSAIVEILLYYHISFDYRMKKQSYF